MEATGVTGARLVAVDDLAWPPRGGEDGRFFFFRAIIPPERLPDPSGSPGPGRVATMATRPLGGSDDSVGRLGRAVG
jgi:hypothetical protein